MFVLKTSCTTNTPWIHDRFRKSIKFFKLKPFSHFYGIYNEHNVALPEIAMRIHQRAVVNRGATFDGEIDALGGIHSRD